MIKHHFNGTQWVVWVTDGADSWPMSFRAEKDALATIAYIEGDNNTDVTVLDQAHNIEEN
ncbi:hypothetical protein [Mycobacteroides abscessus]|uniref:hypothetical protein n=1 Tax=Mycobacteroides abscessus TaxID=36809 RepID=UPI000C25AD3E|nr:hypothetical protein [Mycobacteroides abscessus]